MGKVIDRRKQAMGGNTKRALNRIKNIAVHYSATATGTTSIFENHWKGARQWVTGGYHEVVLLNGDVELNYDADVISNGVGGQNTSIYNICYVGDGVPNAKQLAALIERINYNRHRLNVPIANVKGHREFSGQSTSCPGLNMNHLRDSLGTKVVTPPKKQTGSTAANKGKSIAQMASEVIDGKHGNGHDARRKSLGISASEYAKVRAEVNKRASSTHKAAVKKSVEQMASEVLKGQHGNGHAARQKSLGISKTEYNKVKSEVNKRLMGKTKSDKSISQMATEVLAGKHGNGHANRRKSLAISQGEYNKVRAEVNKRA